MTKQPTPTSQVWLSPAQVGERLGISHRLVQDWIREGRLPASRLGPRMLRVHVNDADRLLTPVDGSR